MSIFSYLDYKLAIKHTMQSQKLNGERLTFEKMAEACRVQKTYLSKVLNHSGDLNADQVFAAGNYLSLAHDELNFLMLLQAHNTSLNTIRKNILLKQIEEIQKENLTTESHLSVESVPDIGVPIDSYYLDPDLQIIHMFLTVDRFARNQDSILISLPYLTKKRLQEKISILCKLGIIKKGPHKWEVLKDNLHLSIQSPIFNAYKNLMHLKALEQMNRLTEDDAYSLNVIFSSNETVRLKIQSRFLELIKEIQGLVKNEPEHDVYQMTFNLIPWSE